MAISLTFNLEKELTEIIERRLGDEMSKEFDKAIEVFNSKKREMVAGILLSVMETVDIERRGENIIFTIREIKK